MALGSRTHLGRLLRHTVSRLASPQTHGAAGTFPAFCSTARDPSPYSLFVGGLSFTTDEDSLRNAFSPHGDVSNVKVIMDHLTGRPRGFGFVTFSSKECAEAALRAMDGQVLAGRIIRVDYAVRKPPTPRMSAGGSSVFSGNSQGRDGFSQGGFGYQGGFSQRGSEFSQDPGFPGGSGLAKMDSGFSSVQKDFGVTAQRDPRSGGGSGFPLEHPSFTDGSGLAQKDPGFSVLEKNSEFPAQEDPGSLGGSEFPPEHSESADGPVLSQSDPGFLPGPSSSESPASVQGDAVLSSSSGPSQGDLEFPGGSGFAKKDLGPSTDDTGFSGASKGPGVTSGGVKREIPRGSTDFDKGPGSNWDKFFKYLEANSRIKKSNSVDKENPSDDKGSGCSTDMQVNNL